MGSDFLALAFHITGFDGDVQFLDDGKCLLRCRTNSGVVVFWGDLTEEYGMDNINKIKELENYLPVDVGCQCIIPSWQSKRDYKYDYSVPDEAEIEVLDSKLE